MPGLAIEIWMLVAELMEPNPFEYLRLSHVCRASRAALLHDHFWRRFSPFKQDTNLAEAFMERFKRKPPALRRAIIQNYRSNVQLMGCAPVNLPAETDLDYQLSVAASGAIPLSECESLQFWSCCVLINPDSYEVAPNSLKTNIDFTLAALDAGLNPFMIPQQVLQDHTVSTVAVDVRPMVLARMSKSYIEANRPMVQTAVQKEAWALSSAHKFRDDHEIVALAIAQTGQALGFASSSLQGDRSLVLKAVASYGHALKYATELQDDREIVLLAVQNCGGALQYASPALKADKQIVLAAVKNDPESRKYALPKLQLDSDIVMAALMKMRH